MNLGTSVQGFQAPEGAVSLKVVARHTGLSIATVSRILRGQGKATSATRSRVLEAARELKYRPNLLIRGIQTGRTGNVGVLMPFVDELFVRILSGVHDALLEQGAMPLLCRCRTDGRGGYIGKTEMEIIHALVDRRVDGVILMPVEDAASDDYLREIWDRGLPLVAVDRELPHSHADFVGTDDEAGGRLAAEHLLQAGHRRLMHIAGPSFTSTGRLRRLGFEAAVREAGATCTTLESPGFSAVPGEAAMILRGPDAPTAVFCGNDWIAMQLYDLAASMGMRIPASLSVIGFGNLSAAAVKTPAITTFDQTPIEVGREAARLLLARLDDEIPEAETRKIRLPPQLVERASVACSSPATIKPKKRGNT